MPTQREGVVMPEVFPIVSDDGLAKVQHYSLAEVADMFHMHHSTAARLAKRRTPWAASHGGRGDFWFSEADIAEIVRHMRANDGPRGARRRRPARHRPPARGRRRPTGDPMSRYYPVGVCGCHDCTCPGCYRCDPSEADDIALAPCPACQVGECADCDHGRIACPCALAGHQ